MSELPQERTARLLRDQARGCSALGSPLYGDLLRHAADDLLAGGPVYDLLVNHLLDAGPSALALRLMAGAHALALTGQAPQLAEFYPSAGGSADPGPGADRAWTALRQTFDQERDTIADWLTRPPQTNEVGRAAVLIGGLRHLAAQTGLPSAPIRLVEIGASAGLNLRADHFHISGNGAGYGDPGSPVDLGEAWHGAVPPDARFDIVERTGGDLTPIDPLSRQGQVALLAYVWPDQRERVARLRGALEIAERVPAGLRKESAIDTLRRVSLADDITTVVWHSVFWQYLEAEEKAAVEDRLAELGSRATVRSRLAHLSLEPRRRTPQSSHEMLVSLTVWPGGDERLLGSAAPHGVPVSWE